jgi:hypothetical protein
MAKGITATATITVELLKNPYEPGETTEQFAARMAEQIGITGFIIQDIREQLDFVDVTACGGEPETVRGQHSMTISLERVECG